MNERTVTKTLIKAIKARTSLSSGEWAQAKFPTDGDASLALDILEGLGLEQDGLMESKMASPVARTIVKIWFPSWADGSAVEALRMLKMEV